jgi:hypothetical protein
MSQKVKGLGMSEEGRKEGGRKEGREEGREEGGGEGDITDLWSLFRRVVQSQ